MGSAIVVASVVSYGRSASAQAICTATGPGTYACSGASVTPQLIGVPVPVPSADVTISAPLSVDTTATAGAPGIGVAAVGDVTIDDTSGGAIAASYFGLGAQSAAGSVSITSDSDITGSTAVAAQSYGAGDIDIALTGAATGTSTDSAVYALQDAATGGSITVETDAVTAATGYGVYAQHNGVGDVAVTTNGDVTGGSQGIVVNATNAASTGEITVNAGNVTGGNAGINAFQQGDGDLTVTSTGAVVAPGGVAAPVGPIGIRAYGFGDGSITVNAVDVSSVEGIFAYGTGNNEITVTATGDVVGTDSAAIIASAVSASNTSDVTVNAVNSTGKEIGIGAVTYGTGDVSVTSTGAAVGGDYTGIAALSISTTGAGNVTVSSADATGGEFGIYAGTQGNGNVTVTSTGAATGTAYTGIAAGIDSATGAGNVSVTAADATGGDFGIYAGTYGTGSVTVTASGNVSGTDEDGVFAGIDNATNTSDVLVTAATVTGGKNGIEVTTNGTGGLTVTSSGVVIGTAEMGINTDQQNTGTTGDVTVTANGDVFGATDGIFGSNAGTGGVTVTSTADVAATAGDGITATLTAASTGDASVTANTVTGSNDGIVAETLGTGAVSVTASDAVEGTTGTGITATITNGANASDITVTAAATTGAVDGINATTDGTGGVSVTATDAVEGAANTGIVATITNTANASAVTVNADAAQGVDYGIFAGTYGTGAVTVTSTGPVVASGTTGIFAGSNNVGNASDISVTAVDATGAEYGIQAGTYGTGSVTVTSTGTATGTAYSGIGVLLTNPSNTGDITINGTNANGGEYGIYAKHNGGGAVTVTATGDVVGTAESGILAEVDNATSGGDVTVAASAAVTGATAGIDASNDGTGGVSVTSTAAVTASAGDGIVAETTAASTGDVSVSAADVTGSAAGIVADQQGTGALSVTSNLGTVTGSAGDGISAGIDNAANANDVAISVAAGSSVTGATDGIDADTNGTGAVTVTNSGTVTATAGAGIAAEQTGTGTTGDVTVTNSGTTNGGTAGILAANDGTGGVTVTSTGTVSASTGIGIETTQTAASTGDAVVNAATVTGAGDGINVDNVGTGASTVAATGTVVSTGGTAIAVNHGQAGSTGDVTVTAQDVTGATGGITVDSVADSAVAVTATGNVTTTAGTGVFVETTGNATSIAVTTQGTVTGEDGIVVSELSGAGATPITIDAQDDVTGNGAATGIGIAVLSSSPSGTPAVNLTTAADITGVQSGIAVMANAAGEYTGPTRIEVTNGSTVAASGGAAIYVGDTTGAASATTTVADVIIDGTVTGGTHAVLLAAGDDNVTLSETASVTGTVDAGAGTDVLLLDFATPGSFDVSNVGAGLQYQNFEEYQSDGLVTLTGNAVAGGIPTWTVLAGTTTVAGNMADTDMAVNSGATLSFGPASTVGDMTVDGTLSLGTAGTPGGTLTSSGNIVFNTGSVLEVEFQDNGTTADAITTTGTVTINSGATLDTTLIGASTNLPITGAIPIVTGSAVSGTFDTVNDNMVDYIVTANYTGTTVELQFDIDPSALSDKFIAGVGAIGARNAGSALAQSILSWEGYGLNAMVPQSRTERNRVTSGQEFFVFGGFFGSETEVSAKGGNSGYETDVSGLMVGGEMAMETGDIGTLRAGLSFGKTDSTFRAGGDFGSAEGKFVSAHLRYESGALRASAVISRGELDYTTTRNVTTGVVADGATTGTSQTFAAELSYDLSTGTVGDGSLEIRPFLGFDVSRASLDGYSETGAGAFNATVADQDSTLRTTRVGVEFAQSFESGNLIIRPTARIGLERLSGDLGATVTGTFGAGTAFSDSLADMDDSRVTLGAGVTVGNESTEGYFQVNSIAGDDDSLSASAGISFRF